MAWTQVILIWKFQGYVILSIISITRRNMSFHGTKCFIENICLCKFDYVLNTCLNVKPVHTRETAVKMEDNRPTLCFILLINLPMI